MHIKQIVIQGFKSYKDQTIIDPFSPKHNVVVGGNGSGKSNFFAAIRFVLSDAYTHMSREERQALLHEGAGSAVMSAYVEIIFDNTDNRFPTGKDEVTLRRTIGLKKDEYSLDKKSSSKSDVMNLLESAGFSRSNPYYIVPQGRITALTNAKDHERLLLLKEVAGTQVYEQRRTESIKIMEDTKLKQSKIDELLEYIEERLNELEEEKEELREFQEKDREKRCLEYTIYERELSEVNNQLNLIEEERVRVGNISDDRTAEFEERDEQIARLDTEIAELQQKVELIAFEKRQLDKEHRERVKVRAQIEMEVQDISQDLGRSEQSQLEVVNELQNLDNEIRGKQEELTDMTPTFEAKRAEELDIQQQLEATEGRLEGLYAKQGRNSQFHTKRERDNWLRSEINSITQIKSRQEQLKIELGGEIEETNNRLQHIVQEIENKRSGIGNRRVNIQKVRSELEGAKFERDVLMDERKELWREETKLSSTLEKTKEEVRKAERAFASSTNRETSTALTALPQIIEKYGIQGVYGSLCELFEVDPRYALAVETTAGNSLFHIIVENESIAEQIVRALNTEKKGRLTFMPLKRLRPKLPVYPESSDALPMLTKLRFEDKYAKAFQQVFGKTIICPSLDIASQYARSHGLNAITLVGDRSDRKGALTGGFLDSRKSRLAAVRTLKTCRQALEEQSTRAGEVKVALERKEQEITRAVGKYQSLEGKTKELEENAGQGELRRLVQEEGMLNGQIVKKTHSLAAINSALRTLDDQLVAFHSELSSQFTRSLSIEEEQTFNNLKVQVEQLRKSYSEIASQRAELESRKNILENHLKNHLYLRRDQLASRQMDIEMRSTGTLESKQKELEKANKDVDDVSAKLDELESSLDETSSEFQERQKERNTIQKQQEDSAMEIDKQHKGLERSMAKRALLLQKKEECNRNIRDLGVLPEEAFEKYKKVKSETILKRLHKINEALKRFSHVNKKAFDQYNNFTNQKETLTKRREDLDVSKSSIEELIEVLDHRKEEAIERTFKQVSKNFTVIFEKLAPAGTGRLIMQRKIDRTQRTDDNSEEDKNSVENYVGISISVSFNSKEDEQQRIQQLSGGQKSLCALALIFSIQKCDPAPFYLLDEPDANLDAQYRTAVASLLAESTGQFICTTFRPEMIQQAEKFYGVVFHNKVSSVKAIPKEEALRFVEQEQPQ